MIRASVLFVCAVSCGCSTEVERHAAVSERSSKPPSGLDEDWLRADAARIEQLRAVLTLADPTVERLRELVHSCDVREDRSTGFGTRRVRLALYGGYTTAWVDVLAAAPDEHGASRIAALRIAQRGSTETWGRVAPRLVDVWLRVPGPVKIVEVPDALTFERADAARVAELRASVERELGVAGDADVPAELARAFDMLTSPFETLYLGRACSDDGAPPPGADESAALVSQGRFDLVRRVLRSLNPEGRAWAAHALLACARGGGALDAADMRAIDVLRALPLELACCSGCELLHARFDAALTFADP